jgi:hypothetical protein
VPRVSVSGTGSRVVVDGDQSRIDRTHNCRSGVRMAGRDRSRVCLRGTTPEGVLRGWRSFVACIQRLPPSSLAASADEDGVAADQPQRRQHERVRMTGSARLLIDSSGGLVTPPGNYSTSPKAVAHYVSSAPSSHTARHAFISKSRATPSGFRSSRVGSNTTRARTAWVACSTDPPKKSNGQSFASLTNVAG